METSFLLFANKEGLVCGGGADKTIFQLSKEEPVAMAVSPASPIPWAEIVENYRRKGEPLHHEEFELYTKDFELYLGGVDAKPEWRKLTSDESKLVFMGYGLEDMYPSVCEVNVALDKDTNSLKFGKVTTARISHKASTYLSFIGNFERVEMIFKGATTPMQQRMIAKAQEVYEEYMARVKAKFEDTEYEEMVDEYLANFDARQTAQNLVKEVCGKVVSRLKEGVSSFSIEDLVTAVETIINANMRLMNLQSGGKEPLGHTHEIAVVTRAEGLTWIKHSLFAI